MKVICGACLSILLLSFWGCGPNRDAMNSEFNLKFATSKYIQYAQGPKTFEASIVPENGLCDGEYTLNYYCDGYSPTVLPSQKPNQNITDANFSSTYPNLDFVGLQVIGDFDRKRPSVVYIHGWNELLPDRVVGMPDSWVARMQNAGFNTIFFHWSSQSYDDGMGCLGLGWFDEVGIPCNVSYKVFQEGGPTDIFLQAYQELFQGETAPVRLVTHSLGVNIATLATYRMYTEEAFSGLTKPNRLDFTDPYFTPGLGFNRLDPFDGQIPPNEDLPSGYIDNIVEEFHDKSSCHAEPKNELPANYLSQYCQMEGMLFSLLRDHQVPSLVLSSIVSYLLAYDLGNIAVYQEFSEYAFNSNFVALHVMPIAAYMFSFGESGEANLYNALTPDEVILAKAKEQAFRDIDVSLKQMAGFDTVSLMDDQMIPREE